MILYFQSLADKEQSIIRHDAVSFCR